MKNLAIITLIAIGAALIAVSSSRVIAESEPADTDLRDTEQEQRNALRAFYTAPPVIPHPMYGNDPRECMFCHSDVRQTPKGTTMMSPHLHLNNCLQCHVRNESNLGAPDAPAKNAFEGLKTPGKGSRWSITSPPTIPHRQFLRQDCLSCHNPDSPYESMRTPHPQRSQCNQCHVQSAPEFIVTLGK